jgi:hypothetical protein
MEWRAHIARNGDRALPGQAWERWTLFGLLLLAAVLRFWRLWDIPYTHDEISGLVRTGYGSFRELIQQGVAVDAHPPAVAVFLHYWTMLFGYGEAVVKAPFIILSLAAIVLVYRFTWSWSNTTTALVVTAVLATIQYSVMYAQIARPYAAGFFTCALLADQFTRYLAGGPRQQRALFGVVVGLALCAYVHHFAMLFAAIVAATGLALASREQRRPWLLACIAAMVLYLPNVPIFLQQLGYGGVGQWLAPPDVNWLPDHLHWVVQYHVPFALVLGGLMVFAIVLRFMDRSGHGPLTVFALVWGLVPIAVGMAYSILVAPVLQHSVLLFSFPFLLASLLHGLPSWRPSFTIAITVLVALSGTIGLVFERQHYRVFYSSKYEEAIRNGMDAIATHGPENVLVLIDASDEVVAFYLELWKMDPQDFPYVQLRGTGFNPQRLDSLLERAGGRLIAYGQAYGAPPEQLARIQAHFPTLLERQDLVEGQVFRLRDGGPSNGLTDRRLVAKATPAGSHGGKWDVHEDLPIHQGPDGATWWDFQGREFGAGLELELDEWDMHARTQIEILMHVECLAPGGDAGAVVELRDANGLRFYRTAEWAELRPAGGRGTLIVATQPGDAHMHSALPTLRTYLHNRSGADLRLASIEVYLRASNPLYYGLFTPVPQHVPYGTKQ